MQISTGKKPRAQKVVLYGPEGIGKTSLAAQFPDPLFIDTEGSTAPYDVKRAEPAPTSWTMLMSYVDEAARGTAPCSTLVIDTADWAERLCIRHVCADHKWAGIEDTGYGKGYKYVNDEFAKLLDRLSDVAERGINVVVTAHARVVKFEQPDEMGAYDRWAMKLVDTPKASNASLLKEWADMVLFLNYRTEVVVDDKTKKGKGVGGKRKMYTQHRPVWDAKNRHGLPEELPLDFAGIAHCIPDMKKAPQEPPTAPQAAVPEPEGQAPAETPERPHEPVRIEFEDATPAHLKPLLDLMEASGASVADVTSYVEAQGWYPAGTPLENYEEGAVAWLVANWDTVGKDIPVPFN